LFEAPDQHVLRSVPIDGGPVTTIAALPGTLMAGVEGPDGVHLELGREGRGEAWRVTQEGRVEPEGMEGLVIPAPSGGWRAIRTLAGEYRFRLVAPDVTSTRDIVASAGRPTWMDDHHFGYASNGAFHVVDVTTGIETASVAAASASGVAVLAADGSRWFDVHHIDTVTAYLIVNFGDRPR
jgi:hypothetical protein